MAANKLENHDLEKAFRLFQSDDHNDGMVSLREFVSGLSKIGMPLNKKNGTSARHTTPDARHPAK